MNLQCQALQCRRRAAKYREVARRDREEGLVYARDSAAACADLLEADADGIDAVRRALAKKKVGG